MKQKNIKLNKKISYLNFMLYTNKKKYENQLINKK